MPGSRLQIEVDAHVHASLAEVAVERAVVVVLAHQRVNRAQVRSEAGGRNRRVFPSFPRRAACRAESPTAPSADSRTCQTRGGFVRSAHDVLRPRIERGQPRAEPFGLRIGVLARPRAELHEQHALAFGQQLELVEPHPFRAKRIRNRVVEPFEADRLVGEDLAARDRPR